MNAENHAAAVCLGPLSQTNKFCMDIDRHFDLMDVDGGLLLDFTHCEFKVQVLQAGRVEAGAEPISQ